ncbi:hypothetical protein GY45DRAFT_1438358 [Cubamyces sp. BRFM 1775]|nr:hypothetical protein GY45DRAFT_1438358 [Cubamyces sp. BRFM 1775]
MCQHQKAPRVFCIHPTPAQQQASVALVERLKIECKESSPFANRLLHDIPDAQRLEYLSDFEQLQRLITELDHELPHYACVMEDAIRKLVLMVLAVQQQRELLFSGVPKYFLPLDRIKGMMQQVQSAAEAFETFAMSAQHFDVASSGAQWASEGSEQVRDI